MPEAELSDDVENEVQASAVSGREFRCSSNFYWDILLYFYIVTLRAILVAKLAKQGLSLLNNSCYIDETINVDGWKMHVYTIVDYST